MSCLYLDERDGFCKDERTGEIHFITSGSCRCQMDRKLLKFDEYGDCTLDDDSYTECKEYEEV